jgi:hypothetical protein
MNTKAAAALDPHVPAETLTIQEFCKSHRISMSYFYLLRDRGLAPKVMRLGRRILITKESAAEWRRTHSENKQSEKTP